MKRQGEPLTEKARGNNYLPKFCSNAINLLLMLQDLLAISLKQQGGHTQAVGVKSLKLVIKDAGSVSLKTLGAKHQGCSLVIICFFFYLGDVQFLQPVQKGRENGRYLRLQGMTCEKVIHTCSYAHFSDTLHLLALREGRFIWVFKQQEEK